MLLGQIIRAIALIILSFLIVALLGMIIGGVFGLFWGWLAGLLGFHGTAEDALKQLGDPNVLFEWLTLTVNWIWNTLIKPIVDWFSNLF